MLLLNAPVCRHGIATQIYSSTTRRHADRTDSPHPVTSCANSASCPAEVHVARQQHSVDTAPAVRTNLPKHDTVPESLERALLRFMLRARKTASVIRSSRSGSSGLRRPTGSATSCCAAASCLLAACIRERCQVWDSIVFTPTEDAASHLLAARVQSAPPAQTMHRVSSIGIIKQRSRKHFCFCKKIRSRCCSPQVKPRSSCHHVLSTHFRDRLAQAPHLRACRPSCWGARAGCG